MSLYQSLTPRSQGSQKAKPEEKQENYWEKEETEQG
jgi:hypothetical protein